MAHNFLTADPDQRFLLAPDVRDWLPSDHLAHFIAHTVEGFDLSAFVERYRADGRGGAAYHPARMVALVLYAYSVGDRSSRCIERRCREDVAYRVVSGNATPDHATVARFLATHEAALSGLFIAVLVLAAEAGLVRLATVALDGTKMEADAAMSANKDLAYYEELARRIIAEHKANDALEDEIYGDRSMNTVPPELMDPVKRKAAIDRVVARLKEEQARQAEARNDDETTTKADKKKVKPVPKGQQRLLANATDPDSRIMKSPRGFLQGYNAQAVVAETGVVVAVSVTDEGTDHAQLEPMVEAVNANLEAAGITEGIGTVLADAGYWSTANAALERGPQLLIATAKRGKVKRAVPPTLGSAEIPERLRPAVRRSVLDRAAAGEITMRQAADELGLSWQRTYALAQAYRERGEAALHLKRSPAGVRRRRAPTEASIARWAMEVKLTGDVGRALYARRAEIVEPIFGQVKHDRGFRRFRRRGKQACAAEWSLIHTTGNLLKVWKAKVAAGWAATFNLSFATA